MPKRSATNNHPGNVYVVTPRNKTEAKRMEREIKKTGTLAGAKYQEADEDQRTGISAVAEEDIPTTLYGPDNKLLKKATHVSSHRRQRKSGQ